MWTLDDGLALCRAIEKTLEPLNYHCAIGGGVMLRGYSAKDLDVFIYPHKTKESASETDVAKRLETEHSITGWEKRDHEPCGDDKTVFKTEYRGKRIDFFFVI